MAITARGIVRRLEVWSTWKANGGVVQASIPDFIECRAVSSLVQDRLVISFPIMSQAASYATARKIIRLIQDDTVFDEWRIVDRTTDRAQGIITINATSLRSTDFSEGALVSRADSDGTINYDFESVGLTPTQHINTWVLPALAAAGFTWITLGTITPTIPLDLTFSWDSPLTVLLRLAEVTNSELDLRRNGTTGYLIDLIAKVNASAVQADIRFDKNMVNVIRDEDTVEQVTRAFARGAADSDGNHATMARAEWYVGLVVGAQVALVDPAGGHGPIQYDDQLNGTYLRKVNGTLVQVVDTFVDSPAQTVQVASATGITAGDLIQFRADSSGTDLVSLDNPVAVPVSAYGVKVGVADVPDVSGAVNVIPNPLVRDYSGSIADGWTAVGSPTITKQTAAPYVEGAGASIKVVATADAQGVLSPAGLVFPTEANPFGSGFARVWVATGKIRVELVITTPTGTVVFPLPSEGLASNTVTGQWENLGASGADLNKMGATAVAIRVVQHGTIAATYYVDGAQATQTPSQEPLVEGSGGTRLWQAANELLRTNSLPIVSYTVPLVDLEAIDPVVWAESALVVGGGVRIVDSTMPLDLVSRILEINRDYVDPSKTSIVISNKKDDLTDLLAAKPNVPRKLIPPPPPFTPIPNLPPFGLPGGVPGLIVDWNADAMEAAGHVNGEALPQVDDASGNGNHGFQAGSLKPVLATNALNGHAVFDLTGNKSAQTGTDFIVPTSGSTVFTVSKRTGSHVEHGIWWRFATVADPTLIGNGLYLKESHNFGPAFDKLDQLEFGKYFYGLDTEWFIAAVRITEPATAEAFYSGIKAPLFNQDGTSFGSAIDPDPIGDSLKSLTMGNGLVGGGNGLNGKSARFLCYERALSDAEILAVTLELEAVYGVIAGNGILGVPRNPVGDPVLPWNSGVAIPAFTVVTNNGITWLALLATIGVTPVEGASWTQIGTVSGAILIEPQSLVSQTIKTGTYGLLVGPVTIPAGQKITIEGTGFLKVI